MTLKDNFKALSDATAELGFAIEAAGKGFWEGWPNLTEEEIQKQLEDQQDVVEDLLERGEVRLQELLQLEELADEESLQGGGCNEGFIAPPAGQENTAQGELQGGHVQGQKEPQCSGGHKACLLSTGLNEMEPTGASSQPNWQPDWGRWR